MVLLQKVDRMEGMVLLKGRDMNQDAVLERTQKGEDGKALIVV